ncbi:MAG: ATP-dependent zinc metalloprotease FtsH [Actinomycetota bacterium]|nr:ATP-dependent zinc metalloprotease FtsH [Actinomycetota bacterium]
MPTNRPDSILGKLLRGPFIYILLILAALWLFVSFALKGPEARKIPLSRFERLVTAGDVRSATFLEQKQVIEGELSDGQRYQVSYLADAGSDLTKLLNDAGVAYDVNPQKSSALIGVLLQTVVPVVVIVVLFLFFMNQMQGGGNRVMSFGKSRAKLLTKDQPKTSFADVAGVDEAIEELEEVRDYLKSPAKFQAMGAKIPRGVLLFGPPGTGKTLLARAVAGEAGVPFYSISGSDFVEMFVGVGAARVRDLFEQAKQNAPAIVFIDEIDAVGRHRGAGLGGGHDEREQTLNQLLVEMDGFDQSTAVILMAATNRPDILDPALLRPGRFDRQVVIDRPDLEGRKGILRVHGRGKPLDAGVDLDVIARRTPGFTGADLANVINEAALLTARRNKRAVTMSELDEAIDRVVAGPERRSRIISDKEKRVIAYHEGGHALVAYLLPNADPVHKITIIPRGRALGYTMTLPMQDKFLMSRGELIDELAMLLGGRVAEELVFGDITTGAQNDLDRATKISRQMVTEFGMSDLLGPLTLGQKQGEVFLGRDFASHPDYSDQVAFEIDTEIRKLIDEAHDESLEILTEHRVHLDKLAEVLIERETIDKDELIELLDGLMKRPQRGAGSGLAVARRSVARDQGLEPPSLR